MKDGIHPDYKKTVIKCVCGNIATRSIQDNKKSLTLKVELKDLINVTAKRTNSFQTLRFYKKKNFTVCPEKFFFI